MLATSLTNPQTNKGLNTNNFFFRIHIDLKLFANILLLITIGLVILYSATNQNITLMVKQVFRLVIALMTLLLFAQIPPHKYKAWAPWIYTFGLVLLISVLIVGKIGKGAQRWLDIGFLRFQPSEIMKLAVPMMVACYLDKHPLPVTLKTVVIASLIIFIPGIMIAKQPDLGTALMVIFAGLSVVFIAGISFRIISYVFILVTLALPVIWHYLHGYQKLRVLTLLNPERDPLGSGYHIIQSKIAIGSGGIFGKGWLNGSQSHLHFLPEHATDFIFAVCGEEFGLIGCLLLLSVFMLITYRSFTIARNAQTCFSRLLASSLTISFFMSIFVNIGMVTGILPVVGIPLPLISYGGTAMVTFLAGFGILMSISTHRIFFNDMRSY
jgi:rod shape determining protein RodA